MVEDFYEKIINGIVIVSLLLAVCVCVDYADTITANTTDLELNDSIVVVNESMYSDGVATTDKKIYAEKTAKKKRTVPTVSMWARPSVRCGYSYRWYHHTFVDYCPHCRKYGVLYDAHKWQARFEHEWTCKRCGADYDAVVGKEKYDWSHYYLTRA